MHTYYDEPEWPYFGDVENAAHEIGKFCRKWGRMGVTQTKEKWGSCRIYCFFGWYQLGEIIYPGYCWRKGWKILWKVYLPKWFVKLCIPYQIFTYRLAYKQAIKKYPHIKEEILCCADYREYLKGL